MTIKLKRILLVEDSPNDVEVTKDGQEEDYNAKKD